jgi:hypothetical protein
MADYKVIIADSNITVKLTANYVITSDTMITTEDFIYGTDAIVLQHSPNLDMLFVFDGASPFYEDIDFTRVDKTFTVTSPIVSNGDIIRITYTY